MTTHPCATCGLPTSSHIRTTLRGGVLAPLAWCDPCWQARKIPARVPVQRSAVDAMVAAVEAYANGEVR